MTQICPFVEWVWVEEVRGVMPIQSEGARAPQYWAKLILNAASKRQKIAE